MPKTQILVMVLIAAAVGAAVAQAPQGSLTGTFGDVVGSDVASVVAMNHRTTPINGQDIFVGSVWGRAYDGGTVFKGEKVTMQTATFPSPCDLKTWLAVKEGNNGNRLQQRTVRNNGSGVFTTTVKFNGHLVITVQNRSPAVSCAVATDVQVTPAPGS